MRTAAETGSGQQFVVTPITTVAAWHAIAADWDRLVRATPGCTPLQSFNFLATWWECMAADRSLWILAFHDDRQKLAGIAPLQMTTHRTLGRRYRTVEFLGMTEDILVPRLLFPEADGAVLRATFLHYLEQHCDQWDRIELDELAADDPLLPELQAFANRSGLLHRERGFHDCPYLDLGTADPETFWAARSRKMLKNLRANERKLRALGATAVQIYCTPDEITIGYRELLDVEQRSWKRGAAVGMSADRRYESFYARLLDVFARRHAACVLVLKYNGQPIAATMAITFDRIYCSLQIVHDEEFARYSPGTLLEFHEMENLLRSRTVQRYEFLGGALTNKLRWTETAVATRYLRTRKGDIATRLLDACEFMAKPALKSMLRRVGYFKPTVQRPAAT